MNVFAIGASKNIGYFAALRLLNQGATVTYLLRSVNTFDNNAEMLPFIKSGKAKLVHGDGLKPETIRDGWATAREAGNGKVDLVLFTLGGVPNFSLTRGLIFDPADLVTRSLLNTFSMMPAELRAPAEAQPRFVVITSMGITTAARKALPLAIKPLYGSMLSAPHDDKLGAERVIAHVRGLPWPADSPDQVKPQVLADGWQDTPGLPAEGEIRKVIIIRPALLSDGECRGDRESKKGKAPYRAMKDGVFGDGYRVSRKDVAHFIVCDVLSNWERWEGSGVTVAY
ncbi:hypothetical protein GSI_08730 [Ganoderma sinense ZZ0214-1]|uniref:Uncharacterized protein n=1 Tax=Ganoderma sinense ZZ0214-1 TaxID=1077348 RepID=A0A2G8S4I2_9APHY|nr:hypothetical protein GSI_08730 [Ganoderma sinense ZZ0214-1]